MKCQQSSSGSFSISRKSSWKNLWQFVLTILYGWLFLSIFFATDAGKSVTMRGLGARIEAPMNNTGIYSLIPARNFLSVVLLHFTSPSIEVFVCDWDPSITFTSVIGSPRILGAIQPRWAMITSQSPIGALDQVIGCASKCPSSTMWYETR